ncbi:MAG: branched-chain amino acid ABC transporter permease [Kiritimatiellae bacterium]|nr:branched-chain amino acid ABC transporter permease [Kiritimatiellia bacterium]MDW8459327.1 branched-chain amino acid ABC transporter permease [Verrucomicrobiota bacterium]
MKDRLKISALLAAAIFSGTALAYSPRNPWALLSALGVLFACLSMRTHLKARFAAALGLLLIAIPYAGIQNTFLFELFTQMGIFAAMALGLNIVVGMAGLLDLGYAAFFAIGAYTWAIFGSAQASNFMVGNFPLPGWPYFYIFCALAVVAAALLGTLIGLPALRLRGDYLAIVTLGLGQTVRVLANNLDQPVNITNGPQGITPIERPPIGWIESLLNAAGLEGSPAVGYAIFFYLLVLAVIGIVVLVNLRLDRSRFGRAWVAIREDELAARAVGISPTRTKLQAFATGAAFSGVMGAIFSAKQLFVSPESFTLLQSITILAMVILGGMGSIRGALIGAMAVTLLNIELLKSLSEFLVRLRQSGYVLNLGLFSFDFASLSDQVEPAKYERMIFGVILVLMMMFRPSGLIPETRHLLEEQAERETESPRTPPGAP